MKAALSGKACAWQGVKGKSCWHEQRRSRLLLKRYSCQMDV
jgi:hypothetical protein